MPLIKKIRLTDNITRHIGAVAIPKGSVDITSTSTVMTATVNNFPSELTDGVCAYITNGVVTSAENWTLNINNTGAKPVYGTLKAATRESTIFNVNYTMLFVYNSTRVSGGCWDVFYGYSEFDNYSLTQSITQSSTTTEIPSAYAVSSAISDFITRSVNDLTNYYLKSETYTQSEIQSLIGSIQQFHYEVYASISDVTDPQNNVLYLIGPIGTGADQYEEYVYDSTKINPWIKIGDTSIDLSQYVTITLLNTTLANYTTTTDLTTLLNAKQDTLVSGTNIKTINGLTILGSGDIVTSSVTFRQW